jgi:hypothetical protein
MEKMRSRKTRTRKVNAKTKKATWPREQKADDDVNPKKKRKTANTEKNQTVNKATVQEEAIADDFPQSTFSTLDSYFIREYPTKIE